ncbi:type II secretion system F family protein [Alienimonas californiensis]|uniref:Type IV pilin biogenesis protein n=1 Tax=Alienimonas californiensis TaxID=2527989 RepID=A0A517P9A2_9PLAN|nr:type II secretion system F family protein [Alienimonas californiensis]QDT15935.1 type IV pilin biogenesis protein [Alienimonas californiensis]
MNEAFPTGVGLHSAPHATAVSPEERSLPPAAALRIAGEDLPPGRARAAVCAAADRVAAGADPATALREVKDALPPSLSGLLELSVGASLPVVLHAAAVATAERAEDRRRLTAAVGWPLALSGTTLLVAAAALALLAPGFESTFGDFGTPLPWLTKTALAAGLWLRAGWFVALPLAVVALAAGRWALPRFLPNLWPFSTFLRPGEQARACALLATLVDVRTPLPEALRTVGWTIPDPRLGHDVSLTADAVAEGAAASAAAFRRRYLPVEFRTALRRADDPQALAEALRSAAATLRARLDGRLGSAGLIAAALQSVLLVGVGAIVLLLAGAMILPLLNLLNDLS